MEAIWSWRLVRMKDIILVFKKYFLGNIHEFYVTTIEQIFRIE